MALTDEQLTELSAIIEGIKDWTNARDGSAEADEIALLTIRGEAARGLSLLGVEPDED